MLFIQFLIIGFVLLIIVRTILSFKRRKISFKLLLFWLGLWLVMSIAVLLPQTTVFLADFLGIWRGTDVAVYLSIVLIFYLIFRIFVKLEKIEKDITAIIREISLKDKK